MMRQRQMKIFLCLEVFNFGNSWLQIRDNFGKEEEYKHLCVGINNSVLVTSLFHILPCFEVK